MTAFGPISLISNPSSCLLCHEGGALRDHAAPDGQPSSLVLWLARGLFPVVSVPPAGSLDVAGAIATTEEYAPRREVEFHAETSGGSCLVAVRDGVGELMSVGRERLGNRVCHQWLGRVTRPGVLPGFPNSHFGPERGPAHSTMRGSSMVERRVHDPGVAGSSPAPATRCSAARAPARGESGRGCSPRYGVEAEAPPAGVGLLRASHFSDVGGVGDPPRGRNSLRAEQYHRPRTCSPRGPMLALGLRPGPAGVERAAIPPSSSLSPGRVTCEVR